MKIIVYTIAKNEEKHVNRWYESMKEADKIYVLDTGSTDNTVNLLKKNGVIVKTKKYKKWRFDKARNDSLSLVDSDADLCVCTDLDEVFVKGWRKKLEEEYKNNSTRVRYTYNWYLEKDIPKVTFLLDKIHIRNNYVWEGIVHEVLKYKGDSESYTSIEQIVLNHYPDKEKSRSNYLSLLEESVKEDPLNDRNMHYLGREYMYNKKYNESIDTLIKHLKLPSSTWRDERCASMRFISRCYLNISRYDEARMWLNKAIKEAPYLRDPYVELSILEYSLNNYNEALKLCNKALKIKNNPKTYINEVFSFDHTIYDVMSICYYNIGEYNKSLKCIKKAIKISPNIERLNNNKKIIEEKIKTLK